MKKRILIGALIVIVGIGLVFTMSSCDAIFQSLVESASSVSGTVIDARDENATALSGMSLTLTSVSDSTYTETETTSSDGFFSFDGLDPEKSPYTITGTGEIDSLTYTLIPLNVELDGLFKTLGNVPALAISEQDANANAFTFILMWPKTSSENETDRDYDLDLHLTFDTTVQDNTTFWFNGDYGNEDTYTSDRSSVYWKFPTHNTNEIVLDVDSQLANDDPGVETISLRASPLAGSDPLDLTNDTAGDNAYIYGIYESTSVDWLGYARAYVNLYGTDPASDSAKLSDVNPVLYVVQSYFEEGETSKIQSNAQAELLGIFPLPDTDVEKAASMVRTDFFEDEVGEFWVLSWDGAFFPNGPIGSANGTFRSINGVNYIAGRR